MTASRRTSTPENRRRSGKGAIPGSEAHRFKPGQSGNPGGRPKTASLSKAYRNVLDSSLPNDADRRTYAEAIAQTLVTRAMKGDVSAAKELADRTEGRARQSVSIETPLQRVFEQMTVSELDEYAKTGKLPDRLAEIIGGEGEHE